MRWIIIAAAIIVVFLGFIKISSYIAERTTKQREDTISVGNAGKLIKDLREMKDTHNEDVRKKNEKLYEENN